ncbi:hypothetical protein ACT3TS_13080, partial [Specibacter sp. AOP5-B1-6]|uniref:hypothetical protein n=1 Tax=Specibacter sp. AOP5-B1-6 TaxID=3457653 RepID=UPI00402B967E
MSNNPNHSLNRLTVRLTNRADLSDVFIKFEVKNGVFTGRLPILGSCVGIRAAIQADGLFVVGAVGLNPTATRWLHDTLVVQSSLTFTPDGREIQAIESGVSATDLEHSVVRTARYVLELRKQEESADFPLGESIGMYWSSGVLNFGDWAGPHVVHALTGKQPVQGNRPGASSRVLYTVGSILGWIKRNNVDIW